jgi:hypothetical protein
VIARKFVISLKCLKIDRSGLLSPDEKPDIFLIPIISKQDATFLVQEISKI